MAVPACKRTIFFLSQSEVLDDNCERIKRLAMGRQRSLKELGRTYFQGVELFTIYFLKNLTDSLRI